MERPCASRHSAQEARCSRTAGSSDESLWAIPTRSDLASSQFIARLSSSSSAWGGGRAAAGAHLGFPPRGGLAVGGGARERTGGAGGVALWGLRAGGVGGGGGGAEGKSPGGRSDGPPSSDETSGVPAPSQLKEGVRPGDRRRFGRGRVRRRAPSDLRALLEAALVVAAVLDAEVVDDSPLGVADGDLVPAGLPADRVVGVARRGVGKHPLQGGLLGLLALLDQVPDRPQHELLELVPLQEAEVSPLVDPERQDLLGVVALHLGLEVDVGIGLGHGSSPRSKGPSREGNARVAGSPEGPLPDARRLGLTLTGSRSSRTGNRRPPARSRRPTCSA